jgi:hypothetical protein
MEDQYNKEKCFLREDYEKLIMKIKTEYTKMRSELNELINERNDELS